MPVSCVSVQCFDVSMVLFVSKNYERCQLYFVKIYGCHFVSSSCCKGLCCCCWLCPWFSKCLLLVHMQCISKFSMALLKNETVVCRLKFTPGYAAFTLGLV